MKIMTKLNIKIANTGNKMILLSNLGPPAKKQKLKPPVYRLPKFGRINLFQRF